MVMKTKDNRNKQHHSEHLSIWFSQSVQHRTKCIMNTELRHLHFQKSNTGKKKTCKYSACKYMQNISTYDFSSCFFRKFQVMHFQESDIIGTQ